MDNVVRVNFKQLSAITVLLIPRWLCVFRIQRCFRLSRIRKWWQLYKIVWSLIFFWIRLKIPKSPQPNKLVFAGVPWSFKKLARLPYCSVQFCWKGYSDGFQKLQGIFGLFLITLVASISFSLDLVFFSILYIHMCRKGYFGNFVTLMVSFLCFY